MIISPAPQYAIGYNDTKNYDDSSMDTEKGALQIDMKK